MDTMTGMNGLPFGFWAGLSDNEAAMKGFERLTETEKEHLILRCKDARSREEIQEIVDSLAPGGSVAMLAEEEAVYGPMENTNVTGAL